MSEWQDISTAPRDGSWVILRGGELGDQRHWEDGIARRPVVARWDESGTIKGWFVSDFDDGYGLGIWYDAPTHWIPIPTYSEVWPPDAVPEVKVR